MAGSPRELCSVWGLSVTLSVRLWCALAQAEAETGLSWDIISGHRSCEEQEELARQGRPAAPCHLSTHVSFPATGADVRVSSIATRSLKATWGRIVVENGMRWGGGSPVDPETGIPSDWNHVDLGPRQQ